MHEAGIEKFTGAKGKENHGLELAYSIDGCDVYEIKGSGSFKEISSVFPDVWVKERLMQFCADNPGIFLEDGSSIFFKIEGGVIVATKAKKEPLLLRTFFLDFDEKWFLKNSKCRLAVPLESNREPQLELFNQLAS